MDFLTLLIGRSVKSIYLYTVFMFLPFYRVLWCSRVHQKQQRQKTASKHNRGRHVHLHFLYTIKPVCKALQRRKQCARRFTKTNCNRAPKCICASLNPCVCRALPDLDSCAFSSLQCLQRNLTQSVHLPEEKIWIF